jgi:hypothetical protein
MLLLAWIATLGMKDRPRVVYEVGDIRAALLGKTLKASLIRGIERFLVRRACLLVVTSEAYVSEYFRGIQGIQSVDSLVIENKLSTEELSVLHSESGDTDSNSLEKLTIGYFGMIRCLRSCQILEQLATRSRGDVNIYMRGVARRDVGDLNALARKQATIQYGGAYNFPEDLPHMYGAVDLVWACYPYEGEKQGNWQWARTNRFYEAVFFNRPLIVQQGTEDARLVEQYDIGMSVDLGDVEAATTDVLDVRATDLQRWTTNISRLPVSVCVYTDEHERLLEALGQSAKA